MCRGPASAEPAFIHIILIPAEKMPNFVKERRADFFEKDVFLALGVLEDVFQPEADAGRR